MKLLQKRIAFIPTGLCMIVISIVIGLVVGVGGLLFLQNHNPEDPEIDPSESVSVIFERMVSQNELVSVSQQYQIVEKSTDSNKLFDFIEIPFTINSFWYRYAGTIKAGVNLENAEIEMNGTVLAIKLSDPYIISNTPDMNKSGVLEENNNLLNPIHIEDVDAFQRDCIAQSEESAIAGGLLDEARANAEANIRAMFIGALGDSYTVEFNWQSQEEPTNENEGQ